MKIEYFPQTDTLSILLLHEPGPVEGDDTGDPDVTLLFDSDNRIAEIVIDHASKRKIWQAFAAASASRKSRALAASGPAPLI